MGTLIVPVRFQRDPAVDAQTARSEPEGTNASTSPPIVAIAVVPAGTAPVVTQPLRITDTVDRFAGTVKVLGGGVAGQAGAVCHGIARALVVVPPSAPGFLVAEVDVVVVGGVPRLRGAARDEAVVEDDAAAGVFVVHGFEYRSTR